MGLPKLLREDDLQVEYPSDTDDEYVTEKGFQPTLPGEHTRLSSALALFRATRILAKVLEKNYPSATTYDLSLQQMNTLENELDSWYDALPSHLKLRFAQDKPSTDVTGSRSPLLVSNEEPPADCSTQLTRTGPRILLYPYPYLPTCYRFRSRQQVSLGTYVNCGIWQAHHSDLRAS